jgi:hypothetical protein
VLTQNPKMAEPESETNTQTIDDQTNPIELKEILPLEHLFNLSWYVLNEF